MRQDEIAIPKVSGGQTRRQFLKLMTFGGAAAAVGGSAISLMGCASEHEGGETGEAGEQAAPGSSFEFDVVDTEVLILGAGNNAAAAGWAAVKEGAKVTIVEKGPFRYSGATGMSWAAFNNVDDIQPDLPQDEYQLIWLGKPMGKYLIDHNLFKNVLDEYRETGHSYADRNRGATMVNHGQYLPYRNEDGTLQYYVGPMTLGQYFRREVEGLYNTGKVEVYDQTMITDYLVNEGRCLGAIGLHLPTGRIRVFRAKATIIATGGCCQLYGKANAFRAFTINSPDNTADADMAAFRRGAGIGESEFVQFDVKSIDPPAFACAPGVGFGADAQAADSMIDINGERVYAADDPNINDRNYFCQRLAEVISAEGRGTERGGIYLDLSQRAMGSIESESELFSSFGIDVATTLIEAAPEMYEHGGSPVVDETMMTEIEGLFSARGAGMYGENGGTAVWQNQLYGNYTGIRAAEYAKKAAWPESIDWSPVAEEFARLEGIRTNDSADGIRPHSIRHHIQEACYEGFGPYRETAAMESALAELKRIREEEVPRQIVTDPSRVYNCEWKAAIENLNMLTLAEMSITACLMREETRGSYVRPEFPEQDDENWACMLVCYGKDGEMAFEKRPLP